MARELAENSGYRTAARNRERRAQCAAKIAVQSEHASARIRVRYGEIFSQKKFGYSEDNGAAEDEVPSANCRQWHLNAISDADAVVERKQTSKPPVPTTRPPAKSMRSGISPGGGNAWTGLIVMVAPCARHRRSRLMRSSGTSRSAFDVNATRTVSANDRSDPARPQRIGESFLAANWQSTGKFRPSAPSGPG